MEDCLVYFFTGFLDAGKTSFIQSWIGDGSFQDKRVLIILTEEGEVLSHVFGQHSRYDFTFYQPVLAVSAGASHCAFVLADGTLGAGCCPGTARQGRL